MSREVRALRILIKAGDAGCFPCEHVRWGRRDVRWCGLFGEPLVGAVGADCQRVTACLAAEHEATRGRGSGS